MVVSECQRMEICGNERKRRDLDGTQHPSGCVNGIGVEGLEGLLDVSGAITQIDETGVESDDRTLHLVSESDLLGLRGGDGLLFSPGLVLGEKKAKLFVLFPEFLGLFV